MFSGDVFSFAVLVYEMMDLSNSFSNLPLTVLYAKIAVKGERPEQTKVYFNMNYSSPKQKFNVMLPNRFKLNLDTAEMMKNKRIKMYQTNIAKVVKENGKVNEDDLNNLVASSLPSGVQFNQEEFNDSLTYLITKRILIHRGRYYQYLDE